MVQLCGVCTHCGNLCVMYCVTLLHDKSTDLHVCVCVCGQGGGGGCACACVFRHMQVKQICTNFNILCRPLCVTAV